MQLLQVSLGLRQDVSALVGILSSHFHHGLEVINALAHLRDAVKLALAVAQRAGDSLRGARVVPQVGGGCLLVQLGDLCAQLVRLHDSEDVLHRGAQGRDLFRKFNGHTPRVADSRPHQGREEWSMSDVSQTGPQIQARIQRCPDAARTPGH